MARATARAWLGQGDQSARGSGGRALGAASRAAADACVCCASLRPQGAPLARPSWPAQRAGSVVLARALQSDVAAAARASAIALWGRAGAEESEQSSSSVLLSSHPPVPRAIAHADGVGAGSQASGGSRATPGARGIGRRGGRQGRSKGMGAWHSPAATQKNDKDGGSVPPCAERCGKLTAVVFCWADTHTAERRAARGARYGAAPPARRASVCCMVVLVGGGVSVFGAPSVWSEQGRSTGRWGVLL